MRQLTQRPIHHIQDTLFPLGAPAYPRLTPYVVPERGAYGLQKHAEELLDAAYAMLKGLTEEPDEPLIHWQIGPKAPCEAIVRLITRVEPDDAPSQPFFDAISHLLAPGGALTVMGTRQLPFQLQNSEQTYLIAEILLMVADEPTRLRAQQTAGPLSKQLLGCCAKKIPFIDPTHKTAADVKSQQVQKLIAKLTQGRMRPYSPELYAEAHAFLCASDDEFRRIRDVKYLTRLVSYAMWFRRAWQAEYIGGTQRAVHVRLMRNVLHFAFGKKKTWGLLIIIGRLQDNERFKAKHILRACHCLVPTLRGVPHSFISYTTPTTNSHLFYLEVDKRDGEITKKEWLLLQEQLANELARSIEPLAHSLFMPHNEEEVLRNVMLLSREVRTLNDPPQFLINFQQQSPTTLTFYVLIMHIVKHARDPLIEELIARRQVTYCSFVLDSKRLVGYVRHRIKEALSFKVECQKAPFMRQDHSIDLARARTYIATHIEQAIGNIRDFNGGLICQHTELLNAVRKLLTGDEKKQEIYLEYLFYGITPIIMRSMLSAQLIKALFALFLQVRNSTHAPIKQRSRLLQGSFLVMIRTETSFHALAEERLAKLNLREPELIVSTFQADGLYYFGCLLTPYEEATIGHVEKCLADALITHATPTRIRPQSLKISLSRPAGVLDPRIGTDRTSGIVIKMLYEGLMRVNPRGELEAATCESFTLSEDKRTYTFVLRRSKWSNGQPVTAHDFAHAWKKQLEPHFSSIFAYLLYPIKNARAAKKGDVPLDAVGIRVLSLYVLQVELEHPAPYFLELTSHWVYSPLCKELDELHPGWAYYGEEAYVCNGPFRLVSCDRKRSIQAVKNQHYWDADSVHLEHIDISVVENPQTALALYQKGELDWIGEPLSEIPPEAFTQKRISKSISSHPIAAVHWYDCNVKTVPFISKKCRQALAIALNRKQLIQELFGGGVTPAYSILPPLLSQMQEPYFTDGDGERARRLFIEGVEELGFRVRDLPRLTLICGNQELNKTLAAAIAKQWREVLGLNLHIEPLAWDRYITTCMHQEFHIAGTTWYSWFNDPSYNLEHLQHERSSMNFSGWEHAGYNALLDQALGSINKEERRDFFGKAEAIVMEELPIIPVFYYTFRYMKKDEVQDIYISHLGQIDFKWARISNPHGESPTRRQTRKTP